MEQIVRPRAELAPYVRLIWALELDEAAAFGPPNTIVPDGIVELVLHYRHPFTVRFGGEAAQLQTRSSVVFQALRPLTIAPDGAAGFLSVRFEPWGAHHFFGTPLVEFRDRIVSAADLFGAGLVELEERLDAAASVGERVALVEGFLVGRLARHRKDNVAPLVRAVWAHRGRISVRRLCAELGFGERRLERTFAASVGLTPKRFASLSRFLFACRELRQGSWHTLTEVAYDCGYYDQSHFIADFKAFSGLTPGRFSKAEDISFLEIEP